MAAFMFNVGRGRIKQLVEDGATFKFLILKNAAATSVLRDLDTIALVLADASTDEADFTNYVRKTLTSVTAAVDDTNEKTNMDCADVTWSSAGGATNNTTAYIIKYYDVDGTDANAIPLTGHDFAVTTNGNDVVATIGTNGTWESTD